MGGLCRLTSHSLGDHGTGYRHGSLVDVGITLMLAVRYTVMHVFN
jgi:hypothetical protein